MTAQGRTKAEGTRGNEGVGLGVRTSPGLGQGHPPGVKMEPDSHCC